MKIKRHGIIRQAERGARNSEHELVARDLVADVTAHRRPIPIRAQVLAQHRRGSAHAAEVDGVIVTFPAGGVFLVGVEEQHHPVAAGGSGDVRVALGEKVEVGDVAGHFQHGKIIAAGEVGVIAILGDGGGIVAPDGVVGGVKERRRHVGPIAEVSPQIDALRRTGGGSCADALAQAILGGHLEVIRIRVAAAHRLNIAAVLGRVFVNKVEPIRRTRLAQQGDRPRRGGLQSPRNPLVPAGDEQEVWIQLKSVVHLFCKKKALRFGSGGGQVLVVISRLGAVGVAAADVHGGPPPAGDRRRLGMVRGIVITELLRGCGINPSQLVIAALPRPGLPPGEEV